MRRRISFSRVCVSKNVWAVSRRSREEIQAGKAQSLNRPSVRQSKRPLIVSCHQRNAASRALPMGLGRVSERKLDPYLDDSSLVFDEADAELVGRKLSGMVMFYQRCYWATYVSRDDSA